jgi:hypothetical protein
MNDTHPKFFEIPLNRPALRGFLRAQGFLLFSVFPGCMGFLIGASRAEDQSRIEKVESLPAILYGSLVGFSYLFLAGTALYFLFRHFWASRLAATLDVSVDGPYLCIKSNAFFLSDRKIHFRSIVDYTVVQGGLMRVFGLLALRLSTTIGGPNSSITIYGVRDAVRIRDILIEVDRLRELDSWTNLSAVNL